MPISTYTIAIYLSRYNADAYFKDSAQMQKTFKIENGVSNKI